MKDAKGFLLIEAMLLMLVLAVGFAAFVTVLAQVLKISVRAQNVTEGRLRFEELLFDLETGSRSDLVAFGGTGILRDGYRYEIQSREKGPGFYQMQTQLTGPLEKEGLEFDLYLAEGARQ